VCLGGFFSLFYPPHPFLNVNKSRSLRLFRRAVVLYAQLLSLATHQQAGAY
jgi:hypothetical protein